jgi:hypothetical protein
MLRNKWVGGRLGSLGLLGDNQPIGLNLLLPGSGAADDWAGIGLVGLVFGATIEPKRTKSQFGVQNRVNGGESVSQLLLKDKAFLTFLGQNPPFELRPKTGVSPPIFSRNPSWLI